MRDYTPRLERILPEWIKVESGGNPRAVSGAGAMGLLQLMPDTAKRFGVKNPYDPRQNLAGALKYGNYLMNRYDGDLPTALMAYHAGEGNMDNFLAGKKSGVGPLTKAYPKKILGNLFRKQEDYPIQTIPGVEPQPEVKQAVDMPQVKEQPKTGNIVDYSKREAEIHRRKLAAQLMGDVWGGYDPNASISGRAIPLNPITGLAMGLRQYMQQDELNQAQQAQGDLDTQKAQALQSMMEGGQSPNLQQLAAGGFIPPADLARALAQKTQIRPEYINTADGVYEMTPGGQPRLITDNGKPLKRSIDDPMLQALITGKKEGEKYRELPVVDDNGEIRPKVMKNYEARGALDMPTTLMPVPGGSPRIANTGEIKRDEAEAMLAPKIQEAQAVGAIKAQQEAALAQQKADIDVGKIKSEDLAKAQLDLPRQQANAENAKKLIDEMLSHPGLSDTVGVPNVFTKWTPGTDSQDFQALQDQLQGENFLQAFNTLKGGGQITEMEGKKATDAIAALRELQSEKSYAKNLMKLKDVIDKGLERSQQKAGVATESFDKPSYDADAMRKKYGIK